MLEVWPGGIEPTARGPVVHTIIILSSHTPVTCGRWTVHASNLVLVYILREFASASERHHDSGARYRGSNQRPGTHLHHLIHLGHLRHHSVITSYLRSQGSKKWTLKSLAFESDARYASQNAIRVQILESVS